MKTKSGSQLGFLATRARNLQPLSIDPLPHDAHRKWKYYGRPCELQINRSKIKSCFFFMHTKSCRYFSYVIFLAHCSSILNSVFFFCFIRRCTGCRKKQSLRTNSFFTEFLKIPLGTLLCVMFSFVHEESRRRIAAMLNLRWSLVSRIYRQLQDLCSVDLENRSFLPFGGPRAIIKCDESKFNHKAKVLNKFTGVI